MGLICANCSRAFSVRLLKVCWSHLQFADEEGPLVRRFINQLGGGFAGAMAWAGFDANQHWPLSSLALLQTGGELETVRGHHAEPWRADLRVGAVHNGEKVFLSLAADQPWKGRLLFDKPRHKINMHLPLDYPRINQFPEWFTTETGRRYSIRDLNSRTARTVSGKEMQEGVTLELTPGTELRWQTNPL